MKPLTPSSEIWRSSAKPPTACRSISEPSTRDRVAQNHRPEKSHRSRLFQHRCRDCLGDHPEGLAEPQVEAFTHPHVTDRAAHFHVSGIPETWKFGLIGSETVTLCRSRAPGQVPNRQPGPNEQSTCSAGAPKGYRSVSVLEKFSASKQLELLERLEPLEQVSSEVCSKRWRASIRRSNGKFFPIIPDDSTEFEAYSLRIRRFERLERSAAVERLERAAVIGERPNRVF